MRVGNASSSSAFCSHSSVLERRCCWVVRRRAAPDLLAGVDGGALDEAQALAALRRLEIDPAPGRLAQKRLQLLAVLDLDREQNGLRPAAPAGGVVLPHQVGHRLGVLLQRLVHHLHVLARKVAVHEVEHRKAALRAPAEAHRVGIGKGGGDDALPVREALDRPQPVAQLGGALEAQLLRRLLHLAAQLVHQLAALAVEDEHGLLYARAVIPGAAVLQAPARAASHVVIEAGALPADIPREFARAVGQQQRLGDGVDDVPRLAAAAEGAEVARAVLPRAARNAHGGVLLPQIHPDEGIALVVLEEDVVVRLVALDERVFQHQRLELARRDDDVEVRNLFHHGRHLGQVLPVEIAADPVFQFFGLADVDDLAVRVQHDIHAGQQRQPGGLILQLRKIALHDPRSFPFRKYTTA